MGSWAFRILLRSFLLVMVRALSALGVSQAASISWVEYRRNCGKGCEAGISENGRKASEVPRGPRSRESFAPVLVLGLLALKFSSPILAAGIGGGGSHANGFVVGGGVRGGEIVNMHFAIQSCILQFSFGLAKR